MTIYQVELTLPIDGVLGNQIQFELGVNAGLLEDFYVVFPGGHAGLTHVRVIQEGSQVIPFNNLGYLTGDNLVYIFRPRTMIIGSGIPLIFSGYNTDDTYPHTVYFTFDIKPAEPSALGSLRSRLGL